MSDKTTTATIELLCKMFPRCFTQDEACRRPLKIGIHKDLRAALNGAISVRALRRALTIYTRSYRSTLQVGAARIGLDGEPAGAVLPKHIAKLKRGARPQTAPPSPPQPMSAPAPKPGPQRSSLADLRAAALARKTARGLTLKA